MARLLALFRSPLFFYAFLAVFVLSTGWIALASIYPMAFDEEFHYGLIQIYATSWIPFGIEHTSDMAQYGAATADASYLFHYLMSFPYRLLAAFGLQDSAIIITLRFLNIIAVTLALVIFRKAFVEAGIDKAITNFSLLLVTLIPIFPMLAAQINYDNLMLLVFAWCVLCIVRITGVVSRGKPFPLGQLIQLFGAVLIGMSVKYALLPIALGMFLWLVWLVVISYRTHKQTVTTHVASIKKQWLSYNRHKRYMATGLVAVSIFFASHYFTNTVTYGSPIPTCEAVFTYDECGQYGPWNRNEFLKATKPSDFVPVTFPVYFFDDWLPGMTERLTFAVAGKTNDFQTKRPLPVLLYTFIVLSLLGLLCAIALFLRDRRLPMFVTFTLLLTLIYAGLLAIRLYGSYVLTAEPVAINGRYLIPLLPLIGASLILSIVSVARQVDSRILSVVALGLLLFLIPAGAGIGTYIVQSESHWFFTGFGQESHAFLQSIFDRLVFPARY